MAFRDALLVLWVNAVYNDEQVQGLDTAGPVGYLRSGTGNPLLGYAELAKRWGISKQPSDDMCRSWLSLTILLPLPCAICIVYDAFTSGLHNILVSQPYF